MARLLFSLLLLFSLPTSAFSFGAISCGRVADHVVCAITVNFPNANIATYTALRNCTDKAGTGCSFPPSFSDTCNAAYYTLNSSQTFYFRSAATASDAKALTEQECMSYDATRSCHAAVWGCDGTADPHPSANELAIYDSASFLNIVRDPRPFASLLNLGAVGTGISFGIGVIIALIVYAMRGAIANFVIHGNLPYKLPAYAEDITVLLKRSQRVNWYGRVIFRVTARLSMTEKQLALVRRYWLGRVIAFDSLRRQRQNELARMHLQLAASMQAETKRDQKPLSQMWSAIKYLFAVIFYLMRSLFSFLFGFLFLRVTIAKLVRSRPIESRDLVLLLEAKQAIEDSAKYLKEYLETAETFDGRDELFNA